MDQEPTPTEIENRARELARRVLNTPRKPRSKPSEPATDSNPETNSQSTGERKP
jgi:hypothetical protein